MREKHPKIREEVRSYEAVRLQTQPRGLAATHGHAATQPRMQPHSHTQPQTVTQLLYAATQPCAQPRMKPRMQLHSHDEGPPPLVGYSSSNDEGPPLLADAVAEIT